LTFAICDPCDQSPTGVIKFVPENCEENKLYLCPLKQQIAMIIAIENNKIGRE